MEIPIEKKAYIKAFVKRTIENNKNYTGDYDVVNLLNSLLGLIVLISEQCKRECKNDKDKKHFSHRNITDYKTLMDIISATKDFYFVPLRFDKPSKEYIKVKKSLLNLLIRIRNGIAHHHIEPINHKGKWTGIKICNKCDDGQVDFNMTLDINHLNRIANYIALTYLKTIR